jgi:AAA domain
MKRLNDESQRRSGNGYLDLAAASPPNSTTKQGQRMRDPNVFDCDEPPPPTSIAEYGLPSDMGRYSARFTSSEASALKLTYFDECSAFARKSWVLKGILAKGETSAWIARPGAGKSALLTEVSVHSAAQRDWRGHRAKEACGVIIFALERADLYMRRLRVYQQRDALQGLPIAVASAVIDLLDPNCVETIILTVREAERRFGSSVGLIVIDTYAKGIAANGGDEDKARDQNRAAANLRNVHLRLDAHIALVGHTGKDENRGARGSNAHLGDVDVMVQIGGDNIKVAQVVKANDQPERSIAQFKLEVFELGRDEDGEPINTAIVSTEHFEQLARATKMKKPKLAPVPTAALSELANVVAADGRSIEETSVHIPQGIVCAKLDQWRDRLLKRSIINPKGNHREQFKRIRIALLNGGLIGVWEEFVWLVT